jgi:hypothetical protein
METEVLEETTWVEVQKLFSRMWLTEKPRKQKNKNRDWLLRQVLMFINYHPDAIVLKRILMNEEPYQIRYFEQVEKMDDPDGKGMRPCTFYVHKWWVTDMQTVLNISPIMHSIGLPACCWEIMEEGSYGDKLNKIIADHVFGAKQELTAYEIKLAKAYENALKW